MTSIDKNKLNTEKDLSVIDNARKVLQIEYKAIEALIDRVGIEFEQAVNIILKCNGRVIVTGIG